MKLHSFGRSFLTTEEKRRHIPWYASEAWQIRKDAIARRVAKKVERATLRRLEREDLAKGISPEVAHARTVERAIAMNPKKFSWYVRLWNFIAKLWRK